MPIAFDHIAIALDEIPVGLPFVVGELGGRYCGSGDEGSFLWRQYRFVGGGILELLEPAGEPGGFLHRFLTARGGGVHHVTFKIDNLVRRCELAAELGFEVVGFDDTDARWQEAFLHPRGAGGIVVQLVSGPGDDSEKALQEPPPNDPDPGPPVVSLVGLRMGCRDLATARRLWCELLEGEARPGAHPHVRWKGSPMRVSLIAGPVDVPLAVEVECLHPVLLPQGRHPVLRTEFEPVDPRHEDEPRHDLEPVEEDDGGDVYLLEEP